LLANHGLIATGPTIGKAMWLAIEVETLAKQYTLSLALGGPICLGDDEIDRPEGVDRRALGRIDLLDRADGDGDAHGVRGPLGVKSNDRLGGANGCMSVPRASSLDRLGMRRLSMRWVFRGIQHQTSFMLSLSKHEGLRHDVAVGA